MPNWAWRNAQKSLKNLSIYPAKIVSIVRKFKCLKNSKNIFFQFWIWIFTQKIDVKFHLRTILAWKFKWFEKFDFFPILNLNFRAKIDVQTSCILDQFWHKNSNIWKFDDFFFHLRIWIFAPKLMSKHTFWQGNSNIFCCNFFWEWTRVICVEFKEEFSHFEFFVV